MATLALAAGCATAEGQGTDAGASDGGSGDPVDAAPGGPDASTCPTSPCDPVEQCGCAAPEACDLDLESLPATACRAVSASGTEESNCTTQGQCAAGFSCLGPSGGRQCRRYCADDDGCGSGSYCLIGVTYQMGMPTGFSVCTKSCSPELATGNGCPADPQLGCQFYFEDPDDTPDSGDEFWLSDCHSTDPAGTDEVDCSENGDTDCASGFNCITYTIDGVVDREVCKQTCIVGTGSSACQIGTCNPFDSEPKPNIDGTEFGICEE